MTFDGAIVDLDGTVYRGDALVPGAERGIGALRDAGIELLFFSNNPTASPADIAERLAGLGIEVAADEVLTATVVAREYLLATHADDAVFVVGDSGVVDQLAGLELTDEPTVADVLLAAIDRSFTYDTLTDALYALRSGEAAFLGTDPDRTIPAGDGDVVPGSGAIIGAIAAVSEREPDHVFGKPSAHAIDAALDRLGIDPAACLVVGDRLDTDIAMGARVGATTALVLTGAHDGAAIDRADVAPDHVLDSIASIDALLG